MVELTGRQGAGGRVVDVDEWVAARGDGLLRLAYVLTGNRVDAEDAVQDALSRALPRWDRIRAVEDPETWVRRMLVDAHTSWWRTFRRRDAPVPEVRRGTAEGPDLEEQDRVWRACLRLPADQRVAVVLRLHERRDHDEIADLTGVREGTVRSRVSRGLAALRADLADEEAEPTTRPARDLETRVSDGLRGVADRSPQGGDLVAGARARLRRRRRTTAGTVAAALAVTAVPIGVAALGGDPPDARPDTSRDPVTADWRTETWRDLSLRVPPGWGRGGGTDWCVGDRGLQDAVEVTRPGATRASGCEPTYGYGVHFEEPSSGELPPGTEGTIQQYTGSRYPDGSWLGYASTERAAVWVVAKGRTTARRVLDTAEPVGAVDRNGCTVEVPEAATGRGDQVSVCHYSAGVLQRSDLLSPRDSRAVVAAVSRAPTGPTGQVSCPPAGHEPPVVVLASADLDARLLPGDGCPVSDLFLVGGEEQRLLTGEVESWSIPPARSSSLLSHEPAAGG